MTLKEKRKKYLEEELKNREIDIKFFIASICEEIKNKKEHMEEVFCKNDLKSRGGYKHMPFLPQPQYGMNCPANAPFVQDICAYR